MIIRKMNASDYEDVYDIWLSTPNVGLNNLDDSEESITRYLARNPETCFVAEKDEKIVGVILSGHDGRRGFIYHLAVSINERKKGIGTALVDAALDALKNEGISKVTLVVFGKNQLGNAFWEKSGFTTREDLVYRNKRIIECE